MVPISWDQWLKWVLQRFILKKTKKENIWQEAIFEKLNCGNVAAVLLQGKNLSIIADFGTFFMVHFQVQLSNPSNKPLVYHAIIAGKDARDFHLPKGDIITIPPKTKHDLKVNFTSRFLRPAHAVLVLVGRRAGAVTGTTLVFNMRTVIDNITPAVSISVILMNSFTLMYTVILTHQLYLGH